MKRLEAPAEKDHNLFAVTGHHACVVPGSFDFLHLTATSML